MNRECIALLFSKKRIIRITGGDSYYASTNLRFQEIKVMKFVNLNTCKHFTGIFMYTFMNNLVPGSFKNYLLKLQIFIDIIEELREVC